MRPDCPPEDELAGLAEGRLDLGASARVHHHLRSCSDCRLALVSLAPEQDTIEVDSSGDTPDDADDEDLPLQPGMKVGRFVLDRLIGVGGMGAVWAANDPELGRAVAVKLLRASMGSEEDRRHRRRRMLREAKVMARLAHPNVVPIFEVGMRGDRLFIVLELVEGETLGHWVTQDRQLDEILDLFIATGRGLAAAHAKEIVHRDFKPENVLIGKDGRPRVTDFGLALEAEEPDSLPPGGPTLAELLSLHNETPDAPKLTPLGTVLGTPAYMSPEQMHGRRADARSDLFSFCTALYAAAAGTPPFPGRSLLELRKNIDAGHLAPPRRKLPGFLRRELERGLKVDPAQRHASMNELLDALERGRTRRRNLFIGSAIGLALLLIGAAFFALRPQKLGPRKLVAVAAPGGVQQEWLSRALAELLRTEVAADPQLRVVSAELVDPALHDLGVAQPKAMDAEFAQKLTTRVAADLALGGTAKLENNRLQVQLVMFDKSGKRVARIEEEAPREQLVQLASRLGTRLRKQLGDDEPAQIDRAQSSFPADPEAARLYVEGVMQLHAWQQGKALETLSQAALRDPDNPRIEAALAQAYTELNRDTPASEMASRALRRANELPPDDRVRIDILRARALRDREHALELAKQYYLQAPDDLERGILYARTQQYGLHQSRQALATLDELRKLPPPAGTDLHIDLLETVAATDAGDLQRGLAAAQRAAAKAESLGARRELALATYAEGNAQRRLGADPRETRKTLQLAAKLYKDADDLGGVASANTMAAAVLADAGDLEGARDQFEQALATYRSIGDLVGAASTLHNLSIVERRERKLPSAISRSREAQQVFIELGAKAGLANALETLGNLRLDLGDLPGAAEAMFDSIKLRRELKHPLLPNSLFSLANVRVQQGEFAEAHKLIDEARSLPTQDKKASLDMNESVGGLAFAEARYADAEAASRAAVAVAEEVQHLDNLVLDAAMLGRALYAQGRLAEAADAVAKGRAALEKVKNGTGRGLLGVVAGRLQAVSDLPGAIASLKATLAEAQADDVASDAWEARLALAELQPVESKAMLRARLTAFSKEAASQGFGLYASLARAAARSADPRGSNSGLKPR